MMVVLSVLWITSVTSLVLVKRVPIMRGSLATTKMASKHGIRINGEKKERKEA